MKTFIFLFLSLLIIVLFSGCKKDENESTLYLNKSNIEFGYDEISAIVYISNTGSKEFEWTVNSSDDFIMFSKNTGTCSKNSPDNFEIFINRENLARDSISTSISVSTSTGESRQISLFILNFPENKIRLDYQVRDAKYDYANDRLIILSYASNIQFVDIYNFTDNSFNSIKLNYDADKISVSPDGKYAVTASDYNQQISNIDLINLKLEDEYNISTNVNDIVTTSDKTAYIFPKYVYNTIGQLSLTTGNYLTYDFNQIGYTIVAELHPSGKYIYALDDSYDRFFKLRIDSGSPLLMYNINSYLGEKIWISKDGNYIFTENKDILHIAPEMAGEDIIETGEFNFSQNYLYYIDQNITHNEFYVIPSNYDHSYNGSMNSNINVYNNDFSYTKSIPLEKFYFVQPGHTEYSLVDPSAEYVFTNSDENKIIVITKANINYSTAWGIEIIQIDN